MNAFVDTVVKGRKDREHSQGSEVPEYHPPIQFYVPAPLPLDLSNIIECLVKKSTVVPELSLYGNNLCKIRDATLRIFAGTPPVCRRPDLQYYSQQRMKLGTQRRVSCPRFRCPV